eukprot:403343179
MVRATNQEFKRLNMQKTMPNIIYLQTNIQKLDFENMIERGDGNDSNEVKSKQKLKDNMWFYDKQKNKEEGNKQIIGFRDAAQNKGNKPNKSMLKSKTVINHPMHQYVSLQESNKNENFLKSKGENLNRSNSNILRIEELKDSELLSQVRENIVSGLRNQIFEKYKSEIDLKEYGKAHRYIRKNIDCKDIIYGIIQDIKQNVPFNKLNPSQYLEIELILLRLLQNEQEIGQKMVKHRTFITHCFVKHENDLLATIKELKNDQQVKQNNQKSLLQDKYQDQFSLAHRMGTVISMQSQDINSQQKQGNAFSLLSNNNQGSPCQKGSILNEQNPQLKHNSSSQHAYEQSTHHLSQLQMQQQFSTSNHNLQNDNPEKQSHYVKQKITKTYQILQQNSIKLGSMVSDYLDYHKDIAQTKFDLKLMEIMNKIEKELSAKDRNKLGWIDKDEDLHKTLKVVHDVAETIDQNNLKLFQENQQFVQLLQLNEEDEGIIKQEIKYQEKQNKNLQAKLELLKNKCDVLGIDHNIMREKFTLEQNKIQLGMFKKNKNSHSSARLVQSARNKNQNQDNFNFPNQTEMKYNSKQQDYQTNNFLTSRNTKGIQSSKNHNFQSTPQMRPQTAFKTMNNNINEYIDNSNPKTQDILQLEQAIGETQTKIRLIKEKLQAQRQFDCVKFLKKLINDKQIALQELQQNQQLTKNNSQKQQGIIEKIQEDLERINLVKDLIVKSNVKFKFDIQIKPDMLQYEIISNVRPLTSRAIPTYNNKNASKGFKSFRQWI